MSRARCVSPSRRWESRQSTSSSSARGRRGTREKEVTLAIARRLRDAASDMRHYAEFDYVVVNDDFARAVADLRRIVAGHGADLASSRAQLAPLLKSLLRAP